MIDLRPISLREARAFVAAHHRHSEPTRGWLFGVGLYVGDVLAGVAIAGRPVARGPQDGRTVEITRVCLMDRLDVRESNGASRLYGALCRAASALGYRRAVTYTLEDESGTSIRAAGFQAEALTAGGEHVHTDGAPRALDKLTLFDKPKMPTGRKRRWTRSL